MVDGLSVERAILANRLHGLDGGSTGSRSYPPSPVDFLLECIGFPPTQDLDELKRRILERGDTVAWRGPLGVHLRYPLAPEIEVRLDGEEGEELWTLWPHHESRRRLRVALQTTEPLPDSPYDLLLSGTANPPLPPGVANDREEDVGLDYPIVTYLSDARRLPKDLPRGHVLAISVSGFALDVTYVGPNEGVRDPYVLEEPSGAHLLPVSGDGSPGGCMELSLRIRQTSRYVNPLSGETFLLLEADAPGRPLDLFVSRWQLEADGHGLPRPGWRIEGAFLFTGRVSGGLPRPNRPPSR